MPSAFSGRLDQPRSDDGQTKDCGLRVAIWPGPQCLASAAAMSKAPGSSLWSSGSGDGAGCCENPDERAI